MAGNRIVVFLALAALVSAFVLGLARVAAVRSAGHSRPVATLPTAPLPPLDPAPSPPATHVKRVVVIVEENHDYAQIIGAPDAPFFNWLASRGALLTNFFGVRHPSLPNYLAMIGGDTFGIDRNCTDCSIAAANLVDQLEAAGVSWTAYLQGLPSPCSDVARAGDYAKKHNPFMYFDSIRRTPQRCEKVVSFDRFAADLASGRLPQFVFVVPDQQHDMHDGSIAVADAWLSDLYQRLATSTAWRDDIRLVVTFDEDEKDTAPNEVCCNGLGAGGRILTLVVGPGVPAGVHDATPYTHYNLLRAIEERFGLGYLGHAARATTIPAISR